MASTLLITNRNVSFTAGVTCYGVIPISSKDSASSTTESDRQITARKVGIYSKFYTKVLTNDRAQSTIRFRKNGADGNQLLTIGASATGEFIDNVNVDVVAAGDEIAAQTIVGAGGSTFTPAIQTVLFNANDGTTYTLYCSLSWGTPAASTTHYMAIGGFSVGETAETNKQLKSKIAGTAKNLQIGVGTNARTNDTLVRFRKNTANGNQVITIGAGLTGILEDTSNTDSIAVDDLINYSLTWGTGTEAFTSNRTACGIETTNNTEQFIATPSNAAITVNANLTRFFPIAGRPDAITTEAEISLDAQQNATYSKLAIYVTANTVVENSLLRLRKNAGNGTQLVTITGLTTGWFEDSSGTDVVVPSDEVNLSLVTGPTGTSLLFYILAMVSTVVGGQGLNLGQQRNHAVKAA